MWEILPGFTSLRILLFNNKLQKCNPNCTFQHVILFPKNQHIKILKTPSSSLNSTISEFGKVFDLFIR